MQLKTSSESQFEKQYTKGYEKLAERISKTFNRLEREQNFSAKTQQNLTEKVLIKQIELRKLNNFLVNNFGDGLSSKDEQPTQTGSLVLFF